MNGLNTHTTLDDWRAVEDWCNNYYSFDTTYLNAVNSRQYPIDAFSLGQLSSKAWLHNVVSVLKPQISNQHTVAVLGCWIGSLVPSLHKLLSPQRIYGIDLDPHSITLSEQFNQRLVENSWQYKGVVADCAELSTNSMQFETGGELIDVKPSCVVNTSCEHMHTEWFHSADSDQLIIMQTNNSEQYDGHINCVNSEQHMWELYPMSSQLFSGSLTTPAYTRYMQIGYR